jgi:hypothetical protein
VGIDIRLVINHKCQFLPRWNVKDSLLLCNLTSKFLFSGWRSCPTLKSLVQVFLNRVNPF